MLHFNSIYLIYNTVPIIIIDSHNVKISYNFKNGGRLGGNNNI